MKITQRMIDWANRIDIADFYLGITMLCFANTGATGAWIATFFALGIYLLVLHCNREAERMVKK